MSDAKETDKGKKRLGLSSPGRLELNKTIEAGQVKQNFSHGRSKMVAVEKKRKRTFVTDPKGEMSELKADLLGAALNESAPVEEEVQAPPPPVVVEEPERANLSNLTESERQARMRALNTARDSGDEADAVPSGRGRPQVSDFGRAEAAEAAAVAKAAAAEAEAEVEETAEEAAIRLAQEEETKRLEEERKQRDKEAAKDAAKDTSRADARLPDDKYGDDESDARKGAKLTKVDAKKPSPGKGRGDERRRKGKLTIAEAESFEEMEEHRRSLASVKRQRERDKEKQRELRSEGTKVIRDVVVPETITVQELANRMAERGGEVVKKLMEMGVMATITQSIDGDTVNLWCRNSATA